MRELCSNSQMSKGTYSSSLRIGIASSRAKTSPASKISARTEMRITAHRSVRRKQPRVFICWSQLRWLLTSKDGHKGLTSTCCEASQILSKSCAAGLRPGIGANSRRSTPIKRASWATSTAVPNADAMACATF